MRSRTVPHPIAVVGRIALVAAIAVSPARAGAQVIDAVRQDLARTATMARAVSSEANTGGSAERFAFRFTSRADSLDWARARALAERATGFRVVVSLQDHRLWVIIDRDTVLNTLVAVAKGNTLEYQGRAWKFTTPRGLRTVRAKESDPVWKPPVWLYAETAKEYGLKLLEMPARGAVKLKDGRQISVRDSIVGLVGFDGEWQPLPIDEHIVFDSTLYVPPLSALNRRIEGQLGKYRLDLGEGYLLHGTPYKDSIGMAATHGCVRLRDEDIEWLFTNVPTDTKVYIY
jgi:hypothetical protein